MQLKIASLMLALPIALLLIYGLDAVAESSAPTIDSMEFSTQQVNQGQQGFGARLILTQNQIHTNVIEIDDPSNLRIRLSDSMGGSVIEHIAIYLNLHGTSRGVIDSDTYIIYQKDQPLEVKDPQGFFSEISAKTTTIGHSLQLRLDFTFQKPMAKSDIIIRIWNEDRNSRDVTYQDALEVVKPKTVSPDSLIPVWFKDNARLWSVGQIDDFDFGQGVQYLIKKEIIKVPDTATNKPTSSIQIPSWLKNNAGWWADDIISEHDFVQGMQYLISQGIISL